MTTVTGLYDFVYEVRYALFFIGMIIVGYYVVYPWMLEEGERIKEYRKAHPLPPTPLDAGYQVLFEDDSVKKVWVYNNRGMDFVNAQVGDGWGIATKQTNYASCWNLNTCDEYILERTK